MRRWSLVVGRQAGRQCVVALPGPADRRCLRRNAADTTTATSTMAVAGHSHSGVKAKRPAMTGGRVTTMPSPLPDTTGPAVLVQMQGHGARQHGDGRQRHCHREWHARVMRIGGDSMPGSLREPARRRVTLAHTALLFCLSAQLLYARVGVSAQSFLMLDDQIRDWLGATRTAGILASARLHRVRDAHVLGRDLPLPGRWWSDR